MKTMKPHVLAIFLVAFVCLFLSSYREEESPGNAPVESGLLEVLTIPASQIRQFRAVGGGAIVSEGTSDLEDCGVLWGENPDVTMDNAFFVTNQGNNVGVFTGEIDLTEKMELGLDSNTTYYYKAYAQNGQGTAYGEELSFATMVFIRRESP